jgi:hypothetical protein
MCRTMWKLCTRAASHLTAAPPTIWDHLTVPVRVAPISFRDAGPRAPIHTHAPLTNIYKYIHTKAHTYVHAFFLKAWGTMSSKPHGLTKHPHLQMTVTKYGTKANTRPTSGQALTKAPCHNHSLAESCTTSGAGLRKARTSSEDHPLYLFSPPSPVRLAESRATSGAGLRNGRTGTSSTSGPSQKRPR